MVDVDGVGWVEDVEEMEKRERGRCVVDVKIVNNLPIIGFEYTVNFVPRTWDNNVIMLKMCNRICC